jgi:hypothetical protein
METCLKAAFSRPMSGNLRVSTMNRESASKLLDKPLMAVLIVAAHEMEPPAVDEEEKSSPRRPAMTRPRSRTRRTGKQTGPSFMSWLHEPQVILADEPYTPAYRLAALLIHKQLDSENWDETWNSAEGSLRDTCMEKGVHPVWHLIGEKTTLLGQFLAFPKAKVSKTSKKSTMGTDFFWVDPRDRNALVTVLKLASAGVDDPDVNVALQKAGSQLAGGRQVSLDGPLTSLNGSMAFVSLLLYLHLEEEPPSSVVKECEQADSALLKALQDVQALFRGQVTDWESVSRLDNDDALSLVRRTLAWQHAPNQAESCTSEELAEGLRLLEDANILEGRDRLTWWRLHALLREGEHDQAMDVLKQLKLDASSDVTDLLPLVVSLNDERANAWLLSFMHHLDEQALFHILRESALSEPIRLLAAQRLADEPGTLWEESKSLVLERLLETLDLERLAQMISRDAMLPLNHPYAALLVSHLAPSSLDASVRANLLGSRHQALQAIHGADVPAVLTPMAEHLLMLMEGIYKETPAVAEVLNTSALKAFSPISRAIAGDGVVNTTHLRNMRTSLEDLNLTAIERRLFEVMLVTLSLNNHIQAYNIGMAKASDAEQLNDLLSNPSLPLRLIRSFSHLVMEHDLGLSSLVAWYTQHDPLSPWAPLVRAALYASKGDELNSAREYTRAADAFSRQGATTAEGAATAPEGDDDDSLLALPLALYRKALIHYAHAKSWSEAVELLDKVPALKTAITERFKLYLRVCHKATTDTNEASRLIRKHVQQRLKVFEEDVEGNMVERTKTVYNEEELDLLRNYPFEQAHLLPPEPFLGRVTAASTHISRDLRRSRTQFEHQFRQAMQSSSPSLDEIYDIAKNAAEDGAFEGLMYLERAQNSSKFSLTSQKRLAMVEQALFSQYKDEIPTYKRRFLHNLSLMPLVIVDTNVLVDALVEKAYFRMNLVFETNLNIIGSNRFHHLLLHHAKEKRLRLMIPDDVRGELRQFAKNRRLLHRFQGALVDAETLDATLDEDTMLGLVDEVLVEYNTWTPTTEMLTALPSESESLTEFLMHHHEVFDELTALKALRSVTVRTELNGQAIYPESTDLDIYRLAMHLSSQPLPEIGSVLVATMDGDFTLLDRAIEERFGFSVAKNHRTLKPWLARQTN